MEERNEKIGFYVCSLIDILGQTEKLSQLNGVYFESDENKDKVVSIFRKTYGIVKKFRKYTDESITFVNQIKENYQLKNHFSSNQIEMKSFSDLITSYVLLGNDKHKLQFEGIYFLLLSNGEVFLKMLANKVALRGGIDIGMGIQNSENEIYGTALLNPYILESKVSKSIRLVIGQELYNYINLTTQSEVKSSLSNDYNMKYALLCKKLIKQDSDGEYILDYLSDEFFVMESFQDYSKQAKEFLDTKYNELKIKKQFEVAKKYQQAIKYFENNGIK